MNSINLSPCLNPGIFRIKLKILLVLFPTHSVHCNSTTHLSLICTVSLPSLKLISWPGHTQAYKQSNIRIQLFRESLSYKRGKAYAIMSEVDMGNGGFYGCLIEPQGVSAWQKETAQAHVFLLFCSLLLNHLEPQSSKAKFVARTFAGHAAFAETALCSKVLSKEYSGHA